MKRILSILLTAILMLSCLPLTVSAAKDLSVEDKFKLLLNDMELDETIYQPEQYYYAELYSADDWVLFRGGLKDLNPEDVAPNYHFAAVGNKLIWANVNSEPFKSGYGVYDVKSGAFYDLTDAWSRDFSGLRDAWNGMAPDSGGTAAECGVQLLGDADRDRMLTILDATRMQRFIADLEENPFAEIISTDYFFGYPVYNTTDYDRDGDFTIVDATKVQRAIAELPNFLDAKLAWDAKIFDNGESYQEKYIVTGLSQLNPDKEDEKMILDAYDDSFFEKSCLLALNPNFGYPLTFEGASIDSEGVLNVDFSYVNPEAFPSVDCHRFACVEISKAFLDDIKDIQINITRVEPEILDMVVNAVSYKKPLPRPADAVAQGFRFIKSEKAFCGKYNDIENPAFSEIVPEEMRENDFFVGYLAVVNNQEQLLKLLPNQSYSEYDEQFFKENALVVLVLQLGNYNMTLSLSNLAVKGDTLYGEADVGYPEMVALPASNIYYDVQKVKRSEFSGVKSTALWDDPDYSQVNLTTYGSYWNKIIPSSETVDHPENFRKLYSYTEYSLSEWLDEAASTDYIASVAYNPTQWRYFAPDIALPTRPVIYQNGVLVPSDESEDPFEDYAYLIFEYIHPYQSAHIMSVYTDGKSLEVYVTEDTMAGSSSKTPLRSCEILKIKKSDLDGVYEIHLRSLDTYTVGVPQSEITPYTSRPTMSSVFEAGWSCRPLQSTPLTVTVPTYTYNDWNRFGLQSSDEGWLLLLRSRAEFNRFLPGFDKEEIYDSAFFAKNAMLVMIGQGNDNSSKADLYDIALVGNQLLYTNPSVINTNNYDENGVPIAEPTAPIVFAFCAIPQISVESVADICCWNSDVPFDGIITENK